MRGRWPGVVVVAIVVAASCGGGTPRRPSGSSTGPGGPATTTTASTSTTSTSTTSAPVEPVTATATVSPDQGTAGTTFTFHVALRGPGTLRGEGVHFGDGTTSGANAGEVSCGDTARADHVSTYPHTYDAAGTYAFSDDVDVLGPPPSCADRHAVATLTLVVAAPLSSATLNGAFVSPTRNIGCSIDPTTTLSVRCATFSPPQLVSMGATGSSTTCVGSTCELGNPAMATPVLPYGSATGGGPFQCLSTEEGVTCTVAGHKGFTISRGGIVRVG